MKKHSFFIGMICLVVLSSCETINSNRILFFEEDHPLALDTLQDNSAYAPIENGDILNISFLPNKGEQKIIGGAKESSSIVTMDQKYLVDPSGEINVPLLGKIKVGGKTEIALQAHLEEELSKLIKQPYVSINIENERLLLFSGRGTGTVIPLKNKNTSLLEIIALGGGLKENSKSQEIHVLRNVNGVRKTYRFDISSIQNPKGAQMIMRNHDIVVVNYYPRKLQSALKEFNPWLNLTSSGLALISIILRFTP
jgi:polysaccharide export outer membrane protein